MGERYGARKAEIDGAFQKERESAGVERLRISRGKQREDRGASGRVLGCFLSEFNLHFIFLISLCGSISSCVGISFCVDSSASFLESLACLLAHLFLRV